ncbi:MAG: molybdopterin molybdotransferase MoeA [Candidatus Hadarchaeales archaeon]
MVKRVVGLEEARRRLEREWRPSPRVEEVGIWEAAGRVLAGEVRCGVDLPPFDRAIYDGYAVRAEDTFGAEEDAPVSLRRLGEVEAGEWPSVRVKKGGCVRVATGAPLPPGADAVVMKEYTAEEGGKVRVYRPVSPGENVWRRGAERRRGDLLLTPGRVLTSREVGALAASGVGRVRVYARPRVGVMATGDELEEPGKRLGRGRVFNSNGPMLCAAVASCGCLPVWLGVARDRRVELERKIRRGLSGCEALVVSGGSSEGEKDLVPSVVVGMGRLLFHGLALKPGKPTFFALVGGKPVFGLPGYPLSALMVFHLLVEPYLRRMSGLPGPPSLSLRVRLSEGMEKARGREELVPVRLRLEGGELRAEVVRKGSGAITSLLEVDGYLRAPRERERLEGGEEVEVFLFGGG